MTYAVLFNPIAGRGRAPAIAAAVAARLRSQGHPSTTLHRSERPGHIELLTQTVPAARILILGGDGSLREGATGWLNRPEPTRERPELGILPFGSGNVVARELGLSLDPTVAIDEIIGCDAMDFDVGVARKDEGPSEIFLAMLGVGFDASIAQRIGAARKTPFGSALYRRSADALYAKEGLRELFSWRPPRFTVDVDGGPFGPAAHATATAAVISNTETYGKGMAMSPGASPTDGELALHVRSSAAPWTGAIAMVAAQLRRPGPGWVTRRTGGRHIQLQAAGERPVSWQLDGDPMGEAHALDVTVLPGALRLIGKPPATKRL